MVECRERPLAYLQRVFSNSSLWISDVFEKAKSDLITLTMPVDFLRKENVLSIGLTESQMQTPVANDKVLLPFGFWHLINSAPIVDTLSRRRFGHGQKRLAGLFGISYRICQAAGR